MGSCTNYCNACGDEKSQINTLDGGQLKNSINENNNRTLGGQNHGLQFGSANASPSYMNQEGDEIDVDGRAIRGPVTLKNGAIYTGKWLNGYRDGFGS